MGLVVSEKAQGIGERKLGHLLYARRVAGFFGEAIRPFRKTLISFWCPSPVAVHCLRHDGPSSMPGLAWSPSIAYGMGRISVSAHGLRNVLSGIIISLVPAKWYGFGVLECS